MAAPSVLGLGENLMRAHLCLVFAVASLCTSASTFSQMTNAQPATDPLKASGPACSNPDAAPAPVQRQPYTVELKTTTVQTLANGATISRESTEIRAEDSQQRTLFSNTQVLPFGDQQPSMTNVHVNDPVEGTQITWNSLGQEARVLRLPPRDQQHGCWQSDSGHASFSYGPARPPSRDAGGGGVSGYTSFTTSGGPSPSIAAARGVTLPSPGMGRIGGALGATMTISPPKIEDLGTATIEGVPVHGQRSTHTIPAGQIGNDQPLVSTDESWTAPSLGVALRSVRDDPQEGISTTDVVRLDLSEPPLSTFRPPEGYKVTVEELHQVPCQSPGLP